MRAASSHFLRLLVLGPPKIGKSATCALTAPGPVYIINSDDRFALDGPALMAKEGQEFFSDPAYGDDLQAMQKVLKEAAEGVAAGRYKTIVWDTITLFAQRMLQVCIDATATKNGETNPMKAYPAYNQNLQRVLDRLFAIPAHVIVTAHFVEVGPGPDGKASVGEGIVPLVAGQAKQLVPARFHDVVFLTKDQGKRVFLTSSTGAFGAGCRSLPGVDKVEADVGKLLEAIAARKAQGVK